MEQYEKLPAHKKMRRARKGDTFAFAGGWVNVYQVNNGTMYGRTTHKRMIFDSGVMGKIYCVQPRAERIWVEIEGRGYGLSFNQARHVGGVFPDRLRAEVAVQSHRL